MGVRESGGERERKSMHALERHTANGLKLKRTSIRRSQNVLLFSSSLPAKRNYKKKISKPKRNKLTSSLKSHTQPDGEFIKNLVSVTPPELGSSSPLLSTPPPS